MSTTTRTLEGVEIDVEQLFSVQVDFSHLRITITAILDALRQSNARSTALEKDAAASRARVDALGEQVASAEERLARSEAALEAQSALVQGLTKREAAHIARVSALDEQLAPLLKLQLPAVVPDHEARLKALEARASEGDSLRDRVAALEAAQKALQAQVAARDAQISELQRGVHDADQAARAAHATAEKALALANANRGNNAPAVVAAPLPAPVAAPAPVPQNNDALLVRLKQLSSALEALTTRVDALEAGQAGLLRAAKTPAPAPVLARVPSKSGAPAAAAEDPQTARQLAACLAELAQIQAALAALERSVASKASQAALDTKAPQSDVDELTQRAATQARLVASVEREVQALKDALAAMAQQNRELAAKLQGLIDASSCGRCKDARPSVKCRECGLSLCDACDEELHGAPHASPAMQAHLRTPLGAVIVAPSPAAPPSEPSSFRASAPVPSLGGAGDNTELRRWAEEQIALLNRKEKATRADIHELASSDATLKSRLDALEKKAKEEKDGLADLLAAMRKLEAELRAAIAHSAQSGRTYTDNRIEELLAKLRELEKALEKGMRSELRRFEKDVLVFLEGAQGGDHHAGHGHDAAVGRIHFRCISCDHPVSNLQGPSSLLYARAIGQGGFGGTPGSTTIQQGGTATSMQIEKGRELYLSGRDGAVYKGRDPSSILIQTGDPNRSSQFQVGYANTHLNAPTTNARGTSIVDHKTVPAPYGAASRDGQALPSTPQRAGAGGRPSSAPYHEPRPNSSGAGSLPPTRPATRSGLRSRDGGARPGQIQEEQKTPGREQQQQQLAAEGF